MRLRFLDPKPWSFQRAARLIALVFLVGPILTIYYLFQPETQNRKARKGGGKMNRETQVKLLVAIGTLNVYIEGQKHCVELGRMKVDLEFLSDEQLEQVGSLFFASVPMWIRQKGEAAISPFVEEFNQVLDERCQAA